ncbi:MAG: hypothetical protein FVQ82_00655 [Planctomycetes bacterium]|nr:hypothetical protein [Planctomycetota bacterium]
MKKRQLRIIGYVGIAVIVAVMIPAAQANSCCSGESPKHSMAMSKAETGKDHHGHTEKSQKCPALDKAALLDKLHSGHLTMVSKSIDKALNSIATGDKKTALVELKKAKMMMAIINKMIAKLTKPEFVNVKCPIMGSPINADKVAKNLIRDYKGQKVAFCCGGCPESWDKLSSAKKEAKLAKVKPASKTIWTCPMHPEIKSPKPGPCPKCNMRLKPLKKQVSG